MKASGLKIMIEWFIPLMVLTVLSIILHSYSPGADNINAEDSKSGEPKQVVIFKMDDLSERSQNAFQRVADIVIQKESKAGFGIIARSLEDNGEKNSYYARIKNFVNSGRLEIWHHGYDHMLRGDTAEFFNMPYQHQYEHFKKSLDLVQQTCDITMRTFGTPGNKSDSTTLSVMNQFPQIEVFLFPLYDDSINKALLLKSRVNMERGTGNMDYDFFVSNYSNNANRDYMILQGHPGIWDEEGFIVFEKIIDFLKIKEVTFMTPYEYFTFVTNQ